MIVFSTARLGGGGIGRIFWVQIDGLVDWLNIFIVVIADKVQ